VDANGLTITNLNTPGYLQISSVIGNGVVIDSANSSVLSANATATEIPKNLSHWYGLNNFFTSDSVNPSSNLTVRSDIAANAGLISLGKAQELTNGAEKIMKGQILPSATLDLTVLPVNNDTITIGGTVFTFKGALTVPAVAGEVLIGADIPATVQNLYNVVKANATLTNLVTFIAPTAGATQLNVVAKTAGANIVVESTGAIANLWKVPADGNIGGLAVGAVTTQLVGGYASATLDCSGANVPANADTVTVNGVEFVFGAGPAQVAFAGGAVAAVAALRTALSQSVDPRIAGLFTFTTNPAGDQLIATATNAGSAGNKLTVTSNIAAGIAVNAWSRPGAPAFAAVTTLIGGVDIESTASVNTHALQIGVDTNNVFVNLSTKSLKFDLSTSVSMQSIDDFFNSSFQTKMDYMFSASERQSLVDEGVYEQLQIEFDNITKLSSDTREAASMRFIEFQQYYKMCTSLVQQIIEARNYLLRTIG